MSFKIIEGTHCGNVQVWETVLRTGSYQGTDVLVFQVKDIKTGLYSLRFFPYKDHHAFVEKGMRYAKGMRISAIKTHLKRFEDTTMVVRDPQNPAHKVQPWTNFWAWTDTPMRQNEANGKFSMVLELNVPATSWQFEYISPEVDEQAAVKSALFSKFRQHFQGCMVDWKPRLGTAPATTQSAANMEDQLFGE
tara:strand:+ start:476 stop:1051 length:576 start_codon:yes stop_codon:yes gene_type:complete